MTAAVMMKRIAVASPLDVVGLRFTAITKLKLLF
jgi:hypothetical protein